MKKQIQISFSLVTVTCLAILLNASVDYWRIVDYASLSNTFDTELVEQETVPADSVKYHVFELTEDLEESNIVEIANNSCFEKTFYSFEKILIVKFKEISIKILEFDVLTHHLIQSFIHPTALG